MKKLILFLCLAVAMFIGCSSSKEPHWSYQACIDELIPNGDLNYSYTVKEIEHNEIAIGDDEIYCFDITITKGDGNGWGETVRYCCFTVVSDGEVVSVDCDRWEE